MFVCCTMPIWVKNGKDFETSRQDCRNVFIIKSSDKYVLQLDGKHNILIGDLVFAYNGVFSIKDNKDKSNMFCLCYPKSQDFILTEYCILGLLKLRSILKYTRMILYYDHLCKYFFKYCEDLGKNDVKQTFQKYFDEDPYNGMIDGETYSCHLQSFEQLILDNDIENKELTIVTPTQDGTSPQKTNRKKQVIVGCIILLCFGGFGFLIYVHILNEEEIELKEINENNSNKELYGEVK